MLASPEFLGGASSLDEALDGLLVHAENFQALRLLGASYHRQAKCIYIDPPYNTAKDIFPYKDGYKHADMARDAVRQACGRAKNCYARMA